MRNRPKTFFAQTIFLAHGDFFQLLLKMRKHVSFVITGRFGLRNSLLGSRVKDKAMAGRSGDVEALWSPLKAEDTGSILSNSTNFLVPPFHPTLRIKGCSL